MLGPDLAPLLPDYPHPGTSESHESHENRRFVGDFPMDFLFELDHGVVKTTSSKKGIGLVPFPSEAEPQESGTCD